MEAVAQNFIKAFGWSILDSFWQCGIVYGLLFITLVAFPKLPAKTRHNLSFISICTMFVWFCITFFSKFNFTAPTGNTVWIMDSAFSEYMSGHQPISLHARTEAYFPFILIAYMLGIVLQILVILKSYLFVQRLKRNQLEAVLPEWKALFGRISKSLRVRANADFKISPLIKVPMVIGYLKPIVLFPASLCSYLDTEQVEAILIHELSHIRRNDYLLNLIKTFIETFLFFNPFVWMAGRLIHIEREHACDDMVLKFTGKPVSYAHALLKLEMFINKQTPAYAMAASGKPQYLFQRIKRITNMKTNYLNLKQQMAALTLAVACLISFAWVRPAENKKAKAASAQLSKAPAVILPIKNNPVIEIVADTIKPEKKNKIKIVVTDDAGNKKEYNSVKELPDSLKDNFEVFANPGFLFKNGDSLYFKQFNSKEWKERQEELVKKFDSPEWKKQQKDMAKDAEELARNLQKKFNSDEWKKQQKELVKKLKDQQQNYQELALNFQNKFNSPEWKKQQEDWAKNYQELAQNLQKKFNSAEWKEQEKKLGELSSHLAQLATDSTLHALKSGILLNLKNLPRISDNNILDGNLYLLKKDLTDLDAENELKDNPQYQKLKEKFEKDVQKLKKKQARKEKKEKN